MKKFFVLFLAVLLVFAFVSCKNEPSGNSGSGGGGGSDMTPEELRTHSPKVVMVDGSNKLVQIINYEKHGEFFPSEN